MSMLYNKNNLAVARFASSKGFKEALKNVLFTKNKTVATDAFRLVEVSTPLVSNPEDYPDMVGGRKVLRELEKPLMINAKDISDFKFPKEAKAAPILNYAVITKSDNGLMEIVATNVLDIKLTVAHTSDEQFPEYEEFFKKKDVQYTEMVVNGAYLAEILEVLSKIDPHQRVTLRVPRKENEALQVIVDDVRQQARALLMPIRN